MVFVSMGQLEQQQIASYCWYGMYALKELLAVEYVVSLLIQLSL